MSDRQATFTEFIQRGIKAQKAVDEIINQPLSHTKDPITSFEAADKMVKSGALNRQEQWVLDAIYKITSNQQFENYAYVGAIDFTAKELHQWTGINYWIIQRRLSGLHNKSKIERTGEKRDGCCVWKLK